MSTSDASISTLEGHVDALSARLGRLGRSTNECFGDVCRRLDGRPTWQIVLTGLYAGPLAAWIALAIVLSRLGQ
jgi:hypothetical protein